MMPDLGSAAMARASVIMAPADVAVGVEHDHVVVGRTPAGDEVGDVAGLAVVVVVAAAVIDPDGGRQLALQPLIGIGLGGGDVVLAGVGEDEDVEVAATPSRRSAWPMRDRAAKTRSGSSL
ncbi:MAG: hypothetical protein U1E16_04485 [Hyphomicrobiales bacterium]